MGRIQHPGSGKQPEVMPHKLNDRAIRLIGIPLVAILIPMIIQFEDFMKLNARFGINALMTLFITLTFWEGNRYIVVLARRRFPEYSQTKQRLLTEAILALIYTVIATLLMELILSKVIFKTRVEIGFRITLVTTLLVYLVYEAIYFFEAWKLNVRKTESLMREGVESQLEVLKNQLDPHFLFNSMNTLAALIDDTNTDAQQYLERQSDVYRYVLVNRTKNTVLVEEEMAFLDAYVYLNKIRFRDNLLVEKILSVETHRLHVRP